MTRFKRFVASLALVGAALGVPIATLGYWMHASHRTTLPGASLWNDLAHTATYSASPAWMTARSAFRPRPRVGCS